MNKILRSVILLALIAAGYFAWNWLFPSDETRIKRVLAGVAEAASFKESQGLVAHATAVTRLVSYLAPDIEVLVDVPELGSRRINGRDEVQSLALAIRRDGNPGLKVELLDPVVRVAADKQTATADATARIIEGGDREYHIQEVRFHLKKLEDDWLIDRAEPLRTFGE